MILPLLALTMPPSLPPPPAIRREFRGLWVASVANIDFPSQRGLTREQLDQEIVSLTERASRARINALMVQVRPSGDAAYASTIEPWSEVFGGPRPRGWDPLKRIIHEAHLRGIEVHAWINPFRARHSTYKSPPQPGFLGLKHPKTLVEYGNQQWFNPADPIVQKRVFDVTRDLLRRYDLDGVHIDDYFYPYPLKKDGKEIPFDDDALYQAYQKGGGKLARSAWRRSKINSFISQLYQTCKSTKPTARFGISPFGIYRPDIPKGIVAGLDPYEDLSADSLHWLKKKWCDYFSPQLYWPIDSPGQPFLPLLKWWNEQAPSSVAIWPGLSISRLNPQEQNWPVEEIVNQVRLIRQEKGNGFVLFSAKKFLNNTKNVRVDLFPKIHQEFTLTPPLKRFAGVTPKPPVLALNGARVTWKLTDVSAVRFVLIQAFFESKWRVVQVTAGASGSVEVPGAQAIAVRSVSRTGRESRPAILALPKAGE